MAQLGYTALYLDNDVVVLTDPITPAYVGSPYDIQARACDDIWQHDPSVLSPSEQCSQCRAAAVSSRSLVIRAAAHCIGSQGACRNKPVAG